MILFLHLSSHYHTLPSLTQLSLCYIRISLKILINLLKIMFLRRNVMLKAIFIDHMGTIIFEKSKYSLQLMNECIENCDLDDVEELNTLFIQKHDELLGQYNGDNYKKEYDIVLETMQYLQEKVNLKGDIHHYADMLVYHWTHVNAYEDTYDFFDQCPLPVYILTNNDTYYVEESIKALKLKPKGIISSEMTHYYKPSKEMFKKALAMTKLKPEEVVYIGNNYKKDILAAKAIGMRAFLIGKTNCDDSQVTTIESLLDVFEYL